MAVGGPLLAGLCCAATGLVSDLAIASIDDRAACVLPNDLRPRLGRELPVDFGTEDVEVHARVGHDLGGQAVAFA